MSKPIKPLGMSPAPRLELFARSRHDDWDAWGNEVESDDVMGDYR